MDWIRSDVSSIKQAMRTGQGRWMMITGVVPTEHSGKMQTEGISPKAKARVSCMTSVELNDLV